MEKALMSKSNPVQRKRQGGFTLIELVIVIGIIALLVAGVVFFSGTLSRDAKISKVVETVDKIQTAVQSCKLKNPTGITSIDSLAKLSTMVSDSQCRTDATDNQGLLAGGIPATLPGITGIAATYDSNKGIILNLTAEDTALANQILSELQSKYGSANVGQSDNTITVYLK